MHQSWHSRDASATAAMPRRSRPCSLPPIQRPFGRTTRAEIDSNPWIISQSTTRLPMRSVIFGSILLCEAADELADYNTNACARPGQTPLPIQRANTPPGYLGARTATLRGVPLASTESVSRRRAPRARLAFAVPARATAPRPPRQSAHREQTCAPGRRPSAGVPGRSAGRGPPARLCVCAAGAAAFEVRAARAGRVASACSLRRRHGVSGVPVPSVWRGRRVGRWGSTAGRAGSAAHGRGTFGALSWATLLHPARVPVALAADHKRRGARRRARSGMCGGFGIKPKLLPVNKLDVGWAHGTSLQGPPVSVSRRFTSGLFPSPLSMRMRRRICASNIQKHAMARISDALHTTDVRTVRQCSAALLPSIEPGFT
ncbi:hypothetical protein PsYK624_134370 [Phanerochaete sordida]|uniref:Uncharacterized protein n=1 Tax=Phanerochaete sordida TaxID=48140 RepID=A0A9P3LK07_9APHY|nr:hypothetical protein PsYK624_134370 [Phanerochaete sordida]